MMKYGFAIYILARMLTRVLGENPCSIQRILWKELSNLEMGDLLTFDYPVIFYNPLSETDDFDLHNLAEFTELQTLKAGYGDTIVTLSSSNAYSHGRITSTLGIYLNTLERKQLNISNDIFIKDSLPADKVYYLFGGNYDGVWKDIIDMYTVRHCGTDCEISGAKTPGIGGRNSGVSFHFHGPGFAEVIHGSKEWFFYPPDMNKLLDRIGSTENFTTFHWKQCFLPFLFGEPLEPKFCHQFEQAQISQDERNSLVTHLQRCTIYPNELLFFPQYWMHATLNLDDYNMFISTFIDPQLLQQNNKPPILDL